MGPSPLASSRVTSATRRRSCWRLWRCTWRASLPRRSKTLPRLFAVPPSRSEEPRLFSGWLPRRGASGMEKPPARGEGLPLPVRGCPLREGEGRWAGGEPGSAGRLGREGRRLQRDLGSGGCRPRERATYHALFRSPKTRGLGAAELVVSDDQEGLKAAIERHFQAASWQRCQVHYARDLLGMVGAKKRKELAAELRSIFATTSREQALRIASEVADRWRGKGHEKVACHLEEHIEECLTCLAFPGSHRRRIRATNGLERFNQELKRRTRVVRIFPNREACLRLVTALAVEQSEEWLTSRRYLDMEELRELRRSEERETNGVMFMER